MKSIYKHRSNNVANDENVTPIIKWAGGKRQLLPVIQNMLPEHYNKYFEPFLGGGAAFFALKPHLAVINDINKQLINMYLRVRNNPNAVMELLDIYQAAYNTLNGNPDKQLNYYYRCRELYNKKIALNESDIEQAALFIFLNKTCFNGLYRVNKSGYFNTSSAHKPYIKLYDSKTFLNVSNILQSAQILCGDYVDAVRSAGSGDLVFLDPPYDDTFVDYQAGGFDSMAQKRVAAVYRELTSRGVYCMLTNSDTAYIRELYAESYICSLDVKRNICRDAAKRTGREVIITNYQPSNCKQCYSCATMPLDTRSIRNIGDFSFTNKIHALHYFTDTSRE